MPKCGGWMDKQADMEEAKADHMPSHWTRDLSQFLRQTEVSEESLHSLTPSQETGETSFYSVAARQVAMTDAKKLIRQEKFHKLTEKKKEIILNREIGQFRDSLQMKRNFYTLVLDSTEELVPLERRRRQIREESCKTGTSSHIFSISKTSSSVQRKKSPLTQTKPLNKGQKYCPPHDIGLNLEVVDCLKNDRKNSCKFKDVKEASLQSKNEVQIISPKMSTVKTIRRDESAQGKFKTDAPTTHHQPRTKSPQKNVRTKKEPPTSSKRNDFLKNYVAYKCKLYYWSQWKLFVTAAKKKREEERVWREKINNFMQRLNERTKHQPPAREADHTEKDNKLRRKTAPAKPMKFTSQGSNQRAEDEDLDEMALATAKSAAETNHQLRAKSVQSLHPNLQGKAKLIRLITTVASKEETPEKHLDFPLPETLKAMDRKHNERKQRFAEIHERKRLQEEEKDRIVREKYEQQLLEAEREKKRKVQEFREKLKNERIQQEKRKQEWMTMKALNETAINHYNYKLITQLGIYPWLRLIEWRRIKNTEAKKQNDRRLQRAFFAAWKTALEQAEQEKITKALAVRTKQLLRTVMTEWRCEVSRRNRQLQVAEDWYDYFLVRKSFEAWLDFVDAEKWEHREKWEQAAGFYRAKVVTKCLQHWMLLPQVLYLEREKEHRKKAWREKVQQVLPDFQPIFQTESSFKNTHLEHYFGENF